MEFLKKINKLIFKVLAIRVIKWVVIPLIFIILWLSFSLFYSSYRSFTVLQYAENSNNQNYFGDEKLYEGNKIIGQFMAKQNHLGIVSVRFGEIPKGDYDNEDILEFKIKEKNKKSWVYENKYRSGAFTQDQFYPFGFTVQTDSKGKIYEFEITSLRGNSNNAVETSTINPIYITKYKFTKYEIFGSLTSFIKFMKEKLITFFSNIETLLSSLVFLLPLIIYLFWNIFSVKTKIEKSGMLTGKKLFATTVFVVIIMDMLLYQVVITGFILGLVGLWVYAIYINKFKSSVTFCFAFLLILLAFIAIYSQIRISIDKATTFGYIFIVFGLIQNALESKKR